MCYGLMQNDPILGGIYREYLHGANFIVLMLTEGDYFDL